jgi:hypothetical protein
LLFKKGGRIKTGPPLILRKKLKKKGGLKEFI